ncbi:trichothecene 15-O-acetyltransferase [Aspergillus alliaceus]|uniref:15-O-acetyltransferase Tri3-domain-containing protein n=1 Tax=Petromyces alliaceus TaxID=209559 RepID=A0A5N7CQN3_PETAA|nr:15-O-acetyltransferase Tri3-domain-containing protein [Aspergillus alliaceus]KAF5865496.1 trichothecene 15-O-acetyltransferase [Aspergillus burnettii]
MGSTGNAIELPRLIPEDHQWVPSMDAPNKVERRGVGCESIVGMQHSNINGQYDLYLNLTLRTADTPTATSLTLSKLKTKLEAALIRVRFDHPECATTARWDDQVAPIIQYQSPRSQEEALAWAQDTIYIRLTSKNGFQLRDDIQEYRHIHGTSGKPSRAVDIYLLADVETVTTQLQPGTPIDVLMHMNHLFWDGISARYFAGDLLRALSQTIDAANQPTYPWGDEIKNLSVPLLDALKIDLRTAGTEFKAACDQYVNDMYQNYGGRGLPFKKGTGLPRTGFHTFTPTESKALIYAIKTRLGSKYTISHLAQAAVIVALLEANPPSDLDDESIFVTPMPVNGRRWLRDDIGKKYYSICETGAIIRCENIKSLLINRDDKRETIIAALTQACEDVKKSFDRALSNPYQQPIGMAVHMLEASFLTQNPMPFDKVASPLFISDGKNERFLPEQVTSSNGDAVLTVDNFYFFLNQFLPYLAIRLESWRDASTLSVCYNDGNYTNEEAMAYLDSVAHWMLAFV